MRSRALSGRRVLLSEKCRKLSIAILGLILLFPAVARAEGYLAAFGGYSFPQNEDIDADLNVDTGALGRGLSLENLRLREVEMDNSRVYGAKFGYFFTHSVLGGNLGIELEAYRFHPDLKEQTVTTPGTLLRLGVFRFIFVTKVTIDDADLDVTAIAVNGLYRRPFAKSQKFPRGRLQAYAGPGVGIFNANLQTKTSFLKELKDTEDRDLALGFQVLGGVKLFLSKHIALFGEYRFIQTRDFEFQLKEQGTLGFRQVSENLTLKHKLTDQQVYGGIAFHF